MPTACQPRSGPRHAPRPATGPGACPAGRDDDEREPDPVHLYDASTLAQTGTSGSSSALAQLLPFLLLAVAFWFLLIRPQRKRAQEAAAVRASLEVGAEVITTAGLYGTVAHVDDEAVLLEVAPGVTNRYAKGAVARVLSSPMSVAADDAGADPLADRGDTGDTRDGDGPEGHGGPATR